MVNVNAVKIEFQKSKNGLIEKEPFSAEYSRERFSDLEVKENVFYEKHSGTIILHPNLKPVDMDGEYQDEEKTIYKGSWYQMYGGSWEVIDAFGSPPAKVEYQKKVEDEEGNPCIWRIDTDKVFKENQGFVVWFSKYLLPHNWNSCLIFQLADRADGKSEKGIRITIGNLQRELAKQYPYVSNPEKQSQEILIEQWNTKMLPTWPPRSEPKTQKQIFSLPSNFNLYEWSGEYKVLIVFIVDRYIVVGFNGLENTVAMKCNDYETGIDENSNSYPVITGENSMLSIWGYGAILIGFKKLHFEKEGRVVTPVFLSPEVLDSPAIEDTKKIVFEGTSIEKEGRAKTENGIDKVKGVITLKGVPVLDRSLSPLTDDEYNSLSNEEKRERDYLEYLTSVTEKTPYLYRFKVSHPIVRTTATGEVPESLKEDILSYDESISGDFMGRFSGASTSIEITCYKDFYKSIFLSKNPLIKIFLRPYGKDEYFLRATHYVDKTTFKIEGKNRIRLVLQGKDITKELELINLKNSMSFDDKKWTHIDLVRYFIEELGGIELIVEGEEESFLPTNIEKPNWEFKAGTNVWECANELVEDYFWLLYPSRDGKMIYKPRPDNNSPVKYTINKDIDIVGSPEYSIPDVWKTRFSVIGKAGEDSDEYKKGEILVGLAYNKQLERELGRSRIAKPLQKSIYSDWGIIEKAINHLWNIYTGNNINLSFQLRNFEDYADLYLFDVIEWQDNDFPEVSGKYLITGISISISDRFKVFANIRARSLW
ncbi:hypothetical protein J7K25_00905 [bacterium]|nr:hypothetical protein [bacterium]